jgi:hypothetical protein
LQPACETPANKKTGTWFKLGAGYFLFGQMRLEIITSADVLAINKYLRKS